MNLVKRFIVEEDGLGTVELVLILAALVSVALIFKKQITEFVSGSIEGIMNPAKSGATVDTTTTPVPTE